MDQHQAALRRLTSTAIDAVHGDEEAVCEVGQLCTAAAMGDVASQRAIELVTWVIQSVASGSPGVVPGGVGIGGVGGRDRALVLNELRARGSRAALDVHRGRGATAVGVRLGVDGTTVNVFPSLDDADDWLGSLDPRVFVYAAYYDASDPTWPSAVNERLGMPPRAVSAIAAGVGGFFDDVAKAYRGALHAARGAAGHVASFVHHPPGWLAAALPISTMENQRYWANKFGGSTGAGIYDAGVRAIASKYLGPQGPALVEAYNKVIDDAARGHVDARAILARAPQIAKIAAASREGPEAFHAAMIAA